MSYKVGWWERQICFGNPGYIMKFHTMYEFATEEEANEKCKKCNKYGLKYTVKPPCSCGYPGLLGYPIPTKEDLENFYKSKEPWAHD